MMKRLPASFYRRTDVLQIARDLLGKLLVTHFDEGQTAGRIVEVEAYNGIVDKASHAYGNRHTARTSVMYRAGGIAYVYLCYGIHHLFNVVTNEEGIPHAILIRAIEPVKGASIMMQRMNRSKMDNSIGRGPGNVSKALGIDKLHTGASLLHKSIFIADDGFPLDPKQLRAGPRIGVDYAQEDALLPYRFYIAGNSFVSGTKNYRS
jgi:DNA-3-methyladenine glycosylase